jgi:hypothetical protein
MWLDTDAMATKDTQRRMIKDNKNRPRDPIFLTLEGQFLQDPLRLIRNAQCKL